MRLHEDVVDILPAMNDQDSNRSPEGNVLRFALHRQGQDSQVCTRCHGMPWRSSPLVLPNSVGLGYRPTGLNVQPSTGGWKGFLPALNDRVSPLESDETAVALPSLARACEIVRFGIHHW
jgi:hypothetical protein